jgi:7,8-dihydropterin-6-yl-methyl-4-(beta-D-ribofuranosyl)aminobenzene 5'-phosphate synthase
MEPVALEPVDRVEITILIDNAIDLTMGASGPVTRARWGQGEVPTPLIEGGSGPDGLQAEHGFSALVTVHKGGTAHTILFDTGMTVTGMVENMRRLEIDPGTIELVVLSHGHYDHTMGFNGLVDRLGGSVALPVYLHPDAWRRRRLEMPGGGHNELPTPSRSAFEGAGFEIVESPEPSFILDSSVLITGEIDRTTDYEQGMKRQQYWTGSVWDPDPLVRDDQALVLDVAGKGLMVLSGCGHAGIVNTSRYASRLTGRPVHAIVGGFHLGGADPDLIKATVADLAQVEPDVIVPGHCSGWQARDAMARVMGERVIPSTVGARIELAAAG